MKEEARMILRDRVATAPEAPPPNWVDAIRALFEPLGWCRATRDPARTGPPAAGLLRPRMGSASVIILDTNGISELVRPSPFPAVLAWARAQTPETVFTTTISEAEILCGIASLPDRRQRSALARATEAMLGTVLAGGVLPLDRRAAGECAA